MERPRPSPRDPAELAGLVEDRWPHNVVWVLGYARNEYLHCFRLEHCIWIEENENVATGHQRSLVTASPETLVIAEMPNLGIWTDTDSDLRPRVRRSVVDEHNFAFDRKSLETGGDYIRRVMKNDDHGHASLTSHRS
jgi:hypothetical protein